MLKVRKQLVTEQFLLIFNNDTKITQEPKPLHARKFHVMNQHIPTMYCGSYQLDRKWFHFTISANRTYSEKIKYIKR